MLPPSADPRLHAGTAADMAGVSAVGGNGRGSQGRSQGEYNAEMDPTAMSMDLSMSMGMGMGMAMGAKGGAGMGSQAGRAGMSLLEEQSLSLEQFALPPDLVPQSQAFTVGGSQQQVYMGSQPYESQQQMLSQPMQGQGIGGSQQSQSQQHMTQPLMLSQGYGFEEAGMQGGAGVGGGMEMMLMSPLWVGQRTAPSSQPVQQQQVPQQQQQAVGQRAAPQARSISCQARCAPCLPVMFIKHHGLAILTCYASHILFAWPCACITWYKCCLHTTQTGFFTIDGWIQGKAEVNPMHCSCMSCLNNTCLTCPSPAAGVPGHHRCEFQRQGLPHLLLTTV